MDWYTTVAVGKGDSIYPSSIARIGFIGRLEAEFVPAALLVAIMDDMHFVGQVSDGAIAVSVAQVAGAGRGRRGVHQQTMR